jgi:hypothetical protein
MLGAKFPAAFNANRRHEHRAPSKPAIEAVHRCHTSGGTGQERIEERARRILGGTEIVQDHTGFDIAEVRPPCRPNASERSADQGRGVRRHRGQARGASTMMRRVGPVRGRCGKTPSSSRLQAVRAQLLANAGRMGGNGLQ